VELRGESKNAAVEQGPVRRQIWKSNQ